MAISIEDIKVGRVFRFDKANRRVVGIREVSRRGFTVDWAYADGKRRGGRTGGSQWCHYFRSNAIEELPDDVGGTRTLVTGRSVAALAEPVQVALTTKCPSKWCFVDLETADIWGHQDGKLVRASAEAVDELAEAVSKARAAIQG